MVDVDIGMACRAVAAPHDERDVGDVDELPVSNTSWARVRPFCSLVLAWVRADEIIQSVVSYLRSPLSVPAYSAIF